MIRRLLGSNPFQPHFGEIMILGKRIVAGDIVEGYRFAWLPTKVRCQGTQKGYWIWFQTYYLWKKRVRGNMSDFWIIRKFINYEHNRTARIFREANLKRKHIKGQE